MLHAAKESNRLGVANILAGASVYLLVSTACCSCLSYYSTVISCVERVPCLRHAKIFFTWHGLRNWGYSIWNCHSICRFFSHLCNCCRYQLCAGHFVATCCTWHIE